MARKMLTFRAALDVVLYSNNLIAPCLNASGRHLAGTAGFRGLDTGFSSCCRRIWSCLQGTHTPRFLLRVVLVPFTYAQSWAAGMIPSRAYV